LLWFSSRQKLGKAIVTLGVVLLLVFSSPAVGGRLLTPLEVRHPPYTPLSQPAIPCDAVAYVVVLAGGTELVEEYPLTRQIGGGGVMRIIEGVRIHRACPNSKYVLSGGYGAEPDTDPRTLTTYHLAKFLGVAEQDIIVENSSWDTEAEARNIQPIVGDAPFVLVASASHMPRALAIFRGQGMDPIPAPTDYQHGLVSIVTAESFYPNAGSLWRSETAIYEYLGMLWVRLRGKV
jgi:uncharacterized SAM-binding protein YcdF (DUF218 family)